MTKLTAMQGDNVQFGNMTVTSVNNATMVKKNLNASAPPTVNDDSSQGYSVGSIWIDTTNKIVYWCSDTSVGSAVWSQEAP